jgi:hypothetical protein
MIQSFERLIPICICFNIIRSFYKNSPNSWEKRPQSFPKSKIERIKYKQIEEMFESDYQKAWKHQMANHQIKLRPINDVHGCNADECVRHDWNKRQIDGHFQVLGCAFFFSYTAILVWLVWHNELWLRTRVKCHHRLVRHSRCEIRRLIVFFHSSISRKVCEEIDGQ